MADYRGSTTQTNTRDMTQTPLWLFPALDREFNFILDAAAQPETALCKKYLHRTLTLWMWIGATSSAHHCGPHGPG